MWWLGLLDAAKRELRRRLDGLGEERARVLEGESGRNGVNGNGVSGNVNGNMNGDGGADGEGDIVMG